MTQEELDALMNGDMDMDDADPSAVEEEIADDALEVAAEDEAVVDKVEAEKDVVNDPEDSDGYRAAAKSHWPPPPPTDDHKMVHQLDDVTKESEEKASEIFDIIENISNNLMEKENNSQVCIDTFEDNITLFKTLCAKFPDIEAFKTSLEKNEVALESAREGLETLQASGDEIMQVMDIMQYQDIHRQKIERVINVMRALSGYMNELFAGKIDDEKRVGSAVHIAGDTNTEDIVNADDIEALLASFGQ